MTFDHAIIKPYFDLCVYIQVIIIYNYVYIYVCWGRSINGCVT